MIEKQAARRRQVVIGNLLTNKVLLRDGQGADWFLHNHDQRDLR